MESCQPTQVGPCRGIKGQLVCTLTLTRSTSYSTSSLGAGHSSHGPPSPRTPYNTHPWPHVSSVVAFFVSFGPRGEGTNPFKTSGPEGSREENATNPTTGGGSRRGVELSKPLLRVYTSEASGRLTEGLSSRERFAHPAAVREASLVRIQTRAKIEAKPRVPDSICARVRVGSPLPPILWTRSRGRRGFAERPHL